MTYSTTCHHCGESLFSDDVFCPSCGTRRPDEALASAPAGWATRILAAEGTEGLEPASCPSCGALQLGQESFCPSCGGRTGDHVVSEAGVGENGAQAGQGANGPEAGPKDPSQPPGEEAARLEAWPGVRRELEAATEGEFEIVRELGRGGMAAVYLARDLALNRPVAIKVMAPGLLLGPGMVERFRQEAVTIASLHHPNIVTIHTVRQAEGLHFFVMQQVEGGALEDLLASTDFLSLELVRAILFQVGTGLAYAHENGVIHRDIKPGNVLLDLEGNAILTDFGIAKVQTTTNLTQTGSTIGTPQYMSPEQCQAGDLSPASDQYSLGVLAYEMLAGRTPFSGTPFAIMQAHTSSAPADIRSYRPDCSVEVAEAVLKMLAKDPADRFSGVAEAIEAVGGRVPGPRDPLRLELAQLVRGLSDRPPPVSPGPGSPSPQPAQKAEGPSLEPTLVAGAPLPSDQAKGKRNRVPIFAALGVAGLAAVAFALSPWSPFAGGGAGPPGDPPESTVASVEFPSASESLLVGATLTLQPRVVDADAQPLSSQDVTWSSEDSTVVSVEAQGAEGILIGMTTGTTFVFAEAGGIVDSVLVTVSEPAPGELTLSVPRRELVIGGEITLSVTLTDELGNPVPDAVVSWRSSRPDVVEVDAETGVARGLSLGQARISATAEDQSASATITVRGRIESINVIPPAEPVQTGQRLVVRSTVSSEPPGYWGQGGLAWSSSDPGVATVSTMDSDSAVISLLREGEATLTVRADGVQGTLTLQVDAVPPEVTLELSTPSASFEALEGGPAPPPQTVQLLVTGDASPSVGIIQYEGAGRDWLQQALRTEGGQGTGLRVSVDPSALAPGDYRATVPVNAGGVTRALEVSLLVSPNPALEAIAPTEAAAREVSSLLDAYVTAINDRDASRARVLFPSLGQDAIRQLLQIPETDQFYLALVPGSLRMGTEEETLDGDVMSSVLGPDGLGETHRVTYTFGRGAQGWFIVSFRAGGE